MEKKIKKILIQKNIKFLELIPVVLVILIVAIIELFRVYNLFPQYGDTIRNYEHLIAGIMCPYIFHIFSIRSTFDKSPNKFIKLFKNSFNFSCFSYLFLCTVWESLEFIFRGYFQVYQYIYDILGIIIVFLLYKYKSYSSN